MLNIINIEQHDRIKLKSWEELQALNPIEDFIQPFKKYIGKCLFVLRTEMDNGMQYTYAAVKANGKAIKRIPDCYIATVNGAVPERITIPEFHKIEHPDGTTTEIPNSELPTISKELNTNFVPIESDKAEESVTLQVPAEDELPELPPKVEESDVSTHGEIPATAIKIDDAVPPVTKEDQCNNCHAFEDIEITSFNLHSPHFIQGMFKDKVEVDISVKLTKDQFIALINKLDIL